MYLDDMFSATEIAGNLFHKMHWGMQLGGGRDIHVRNNVLTDCPLAIHLDARALGWAAFSMPDVIAAMQQMPYREDPWASRYPELVDILDDEPARPKGNIIERNIISGCAFPYDIEEAARPGLLQADNLESDEPGFAGRERLDFRLRPDSPALALGWEPIFVDRIGLRSNPLRPCVPPRRGFEAHVRVERPPLLRQGRLRRPGIVVLRVRNLGDAVDTGAFRLLARDGQRIDDQPWSCTLEPFADAERRFEVQTDAREFTIEVLGDALSDVSGDTDASRRLSWPGRHNAHYPFRIETDDEAMTPWPSRWRVALPQPGDARLDNLLSVPPLAQMEWREVAAEPGSHFCNVHTLPGVADAREQTVFFAARLSCAGPMRAAALLGYDGPVKLFVGGAVVFHDPGGTNPARPDAAAPEFDLAAGEHDLVLALGTNGGKAWGIFLRLLRTDAAGAQDGAPAPVLMCCPTT